METKPNGRYRVLFTMKRFACLAAAVAAFALFALLLASSAWPGTPTGSGRFIYSHTYSNGADRYLITASIGRDQRLAMTVSQTPGIRDTEITADVLLTVRNLTGASEPLVGSDSTSQMAVSLWDPIRLPWPAASA